MYYVYVLTYLTEIGQHRAHVEFLISNYNLLGYVIRAEYDIYHTTYLLI